MASGDARKFINSLEVAYQFYLTERKPVLTEELSELLNQRQHQVADKSYKSDLISALIKSVRGSDPDSAILYLAQALEIGEDPLYLARRLMVLASEDIGNADPRALTLAVSAAQACEFIGMPEARIPLAQVVVYLSCAPKSNSSYRAINEALDYVKPRSPVQIPEILKASTYSFTKPKMQYESPQAAVKGWTPQNYRTPEHRQMKFYESTARGFEKVMDEYLQWLRSQPIESAKLPEAPK